MKVIQNIRCFFGFHKLWVIGTYATPTINDFSPDFKKCVHCKKIKNLGLYDFKNCNFVKEGGG